MATKPPKTKAASDAAMTQEQRVGRLTPVRTRSAHPRAIAAHLAPHSRSRPKSPAKCCRSGKIDRRIFRALTPSMPSF